MSCLPKLSRICLLYSERWAGLDHEIRRLDLVLSTAPEEVKDKCKTLCETVMKTTLIAAGTKNEKQCEAFNMEDLKRLVCDLLQFDSESDKLAKAELTYINASRNGSGLGGHGRSLQRQAEIRQDVNERENERLLEITDSLLSDIIARFEELFPPSTPTLERNSTYDEWLDLAFGTIKIADVEYSASDILYELDDVAYQDGLTQFATEEEFTDDRR